MNRVSVPEPALRLFGGVALGKTPLPGPRARALILALAMSHDRPLSAAALIDEVWGLDAPASAMTALHTMVSRIRSSQWQGLIISTSAGYALGINAADIDYWAVESLIASARSESGNPARALEILAQASDLATGEPATGTATSPVLADFQHRAALQCTVITRLRAHATSTLGDHATAAQMLHPLVQISPLDEPLHLDYLTALEESGQANAALLAYDMLRRRLRRELGTDPSPALAQLHSRLLLETHDGGTPPASAVQPFAQPLGPESAKPSLPQYSFGLRAAPNELLGRFADITAIESLMSTGRLTTILGIGGLGKTRMAQELANRSADRGTPSVIFVELAGISAPEDLWLALADAAGIRDARAGRTLQDPRPATDLRSRVLSRLEEKCTLLVMDNCEHLVDHAAAVIYEVLALCPQISVLATSRAPLSIAGEYIYQLQPLDTTGEPGSKLPASVALFHERAQAARHGVRLDDAVVRRLCRQLDGLPLAIELAAAKVRLMSVEDIERRLANRFDLLVNTDRSAPDRHRTLTAVIQWSWNLLSNDEQVVMRRLSRFPSGFSLAASLQTMDAMTVSAGPKLSEHAVEAAVEALINQSLILADDDPATGYVRFRMLETVREFAGLCLAAAGELEAVEHAMTAWAVNFSLNALPNNTGPTQLATIRSVTTEQDNLLNVLRRAMAGTPDCDTDAGVVSPAAAGAVLAIFGLLASYWTQRGMHGEVFMLADQIMDTTKKYVPEPRTVDAAVYSLAVIGMTSMISSVRKAAAARARLRHIKRSGLTLTPRMDAIVQLILAAGNESKSMDLLTRLRNDPDDGAATLALLFSGLWAENSGEPQLAIDYAERSYTLAERMQDTWAAGSAADNVAQLYSQTGRPSAALLWAQRAIDRMRLVGADPDVRTAHLMMSLNYAALGDPEQAQQALDRVRAMPSVGDFRTDVLMFEISAAAEIAFANHDTAEGLRLYRSLKTPGRGQRMDGPMGLIMPAVQICAELIFNEQLTSDSGTAQSAKELRQRTLATLRLAPLAADWPIIGSVALAVGSWHARWAEPGSRRAAVGLELLALAQVLASRQDQAVMLRGRHEAAAVERHGQLALDMAKRSVAGLIKSKDKAQTIERLLKLYGDPALR